MIYEKRIIDTGNIFKKNLKNLKRKPMAFYIAQNKEF